ncbi:hypothetical protein LX36DRAFT_487179 [Colletotrichum falcatum]|nr:hypothetical protein LX36DRAFT_487179 [Colletotrichum falcatum]
MGTRAKRGKGTRGWSMCVGACPVQYSWAGTCPSLFGQYSVVYLPSLDATPRRRDVRCWVRRTDTLGAGDAKHGKRRHGDGESSRRWEQQLLLRRQTPTPPSRFVCFEMHHQKGEQEETCPPSLPLSPPKQEGYLEKGRETSSQPPPIASVLDVDPEYPKPVRLRR